MVVSRVGGLATSLCRARRSLSSPWDLSPPTPCRSPGALTRVAARTLAQSPIRDQLHRRLQPFRHLHDCSGCFRPGAFAGWGSHPPESAALSRRTRIADIAVRAALDASIGQGSGPTGVAREGAESARSRHRQKPQREVGSGRMDSLGPRQPGHSNHVMGGGFHRPSTTATSERRVHRNFRRQHFWRWKPVCFLVPAFDRCIRITISTPL